MSARAIGIAYASCGCDYTFYLFCKDVYNLFLPFAAPLTPYVISKMQKYLPGIFKLQDEVPAYLQTLIFPTFQEINDEVSTWKGELPFSPKWNYSHFINPPTFTPQHSETLEAYNLTH